VVDTGSGPSPRQLDRILIRSSWRRAALRLVRLRADRVFIYRFDRATRVLSAGPAGPRSYATNPGSGPRRMVFHGNGRTLYLLASCPPTSGPRLGSGEELLTTGRACPSTARLRDQERRRAEDEPGRAFPVRVEPRWNTLVVFAVDQQTGLLTLVQRIPCAA